MKCSGCGRPCEYVHWKLHIPSPKNRRAWDAFWAQYLLEKREIERFEADRSTEEVDLPLLNRRLSRTGKTQRGRRNVGLS